MLIRLFHKSAYVTLGFPIILNLSRQHYIPRVFIQLSAICTAFSMESIRTEKCKSYRPAASQSVYICLGFTPGFALYISDLIIFSKVRVYFYQSAHSLSLPLTYYIHFFQYRQSFYFSLLFPNVSYAVLNVHSHFYRISHISFFPMSSFILPGRVLSVYGKIPSWNHFAPKNF